jgi:hypothetical protein
LWRGLRPLTNWDKPAFMLQKLDRKRCSLRYISQLRQFQQVDLSCHHWNIIISLRLIWILVGSTFIFSMQNSNYHIKMSEIAFIFDSFIIVYDWLIYSTRLKHVWWHRAKTKSFSIYLLPNIVTFKTYRDWYSHSRDYQRITNYSRNLNPNRHLL